MFDWVKTIFTGITNWVTGVGGETVGAVTQSALKGAVSGALIGAATAAIRGDNILKGALKGSAYGGIAGGIVSSLGQMAGMDNQSTFDIGVETESFGSDYTSPSFTGNDDYSDLGSSESAPLLAARSPVEQEAGMSLGSKNIVAGLLQGATAGAGAYLTENQRAENERENLDYMEKIKKDRIAANTPAPFPGSEQTTPDNAQEMNVANTTWWNQHLNKETGLVENIGVNYAT